MFRKMRSIFKLRVIYVDVGFVYVSDFKSLIIKKNIDIVDVFRPSNEAIGIANEAVKKKSKVLWLQYGIHNDEAEKIAKDQNMDFVSDKCIKQEYQRLFQKSNPVFPVLRS